MTDLSERLAQLTPEQRVALQALLAERAPSSRSFPLAVIQEGMWFLEQLQPGNQAYWGVSALRIGTRLDEKIFQQALTAVTQHQEILRTTFDQRDGQPVQIVHADKTIRVAVRTLDAYQAASQDLGELATATILAEPLSIRDEVPIRLLLVHIGDAETLLVSAAHHLLFDRASLGLLLADLSQTYLALAAGQPVQLPQPELQYGDFSVWQQEQRTSGCWTEQLESWRAELEGVPPALELPTDRPRPPVQSLRGRQHPIKIDAETMKALTTIGNVRGATTYMTLLTAYAVLLYRLSGQTDFAIASPASMRTRPELETMLGYFINVLPIRTRLRPEDCFTAVIDRIRDACLAAYQRAEVPFDLVISDLNLPRDLSRQALCQVSFTYGREPVPGEGFGASLERVPVPTDSARFDLELQAFHVDGALTGWFEYDREIFDEASIDQLARQFVHLVSEVIQNPEQPIDRIRLFDDQERSEILTGVNDTAREWPSEYGWVHECFTEAARRHPEAKAVTFGEITLTYREFDALTNQLAHRLIAAGIGRGALVGVLMERSIEMVASLMAVVKTGAAYVPLDPQNPMERITDIAVDAGVSLVLSQQRWHSATSDLTMPVWHLDALESEVSGFSSTTPLVDIDGEDPVYVIYTSGSTGKPKGVVNVHAGLRNRLLWMQEAFPLDIPDVLVQKTPFTFDVSVWEFFWGFMFGAHLVVAAPGGHRDPDYLHRLIQQHRITTIHFVPSMLQAFLTQPIEECTSLRWIICSGEVLTADLRDRVLARSQAELHNLYGPTEAAIDVTHWRCGPDDPAGPVPIGRPIANTQVYVLDAHLEPVPIGVAGELYLGGRNIAAGYVARPDLTAERFLPDLFRNEPGARLYKTGDLAAFDRDGILHFLGRLDHQVKLRGQRVELGEIEAWLISLDGVREAVVTAHEAASGDVRLVAYLTTDIDADLDRAELMNQLRDHVPDYMIPAYYEFLTELPLNANDKVDFKRLPAPQLAISVTTKYVAPEGELEASLAAIWCEVLGVDQVGRDDSFFDLGGHSLLLTEVHQRLSSQGHQVSMVELFQNPTIATLARFLAGSDSTSGINQESRARAAVRQESANRRRAMRGRRQDHDQ